MSQRTPTSEGGDARPVIVLVPGLWHGAWAWSKVEESLRRRGHRTSAITFPGVDRQPGDTTFAGHCEHLRREVAAVGSPVVLVAHSYGGAVATEAADPAHVVSQLFVSAFALEPGESIADVVDDRDTDAAAVASDTIDRLHGLLEVDEATALAGFYQDCDPEEAAACAARLTPEHPSTRSTKVTRASWRQIPSGYVVCTEDRALTVERQRFMASRLDHVTELASGHSPMLSRPEELVDVIERACGVGR